jgi:ribosomal protein S6
VRNREQTDRAGLVVPRPACYASSSLIPERKTYRLTVLLNPQAADGRAAAESVLREWATATGAAIRELRVEPRKTAYPVRHQSETLALRCAVDAPPSTIADLLPRLAREKAVLRHQALADAVPGGKRLKEVPLRKPGTGERKVDFKDLKTVAPKEKAPIEKLEEKIDEILKEEVL